MRSQENQAMYPLLEIVIMEVSPSKNFFKAYAATGPQMNIPNVLTVANWEFVELLETINDTKGHSSPQS